MEDLAEISCLSFDEVEGEDEDEESDSDCESDIESPGTRHSMTSMPVTTSTFSRLGASLETDDDDSKQRQRRASTGSILKTPTPPTVAPPAPPRSPQTQAPAYFRMVKGAAN
mmetsp:Transcript_48346/g.135517  ORF Transcript_48346/g.135517 Transcript_48346/m.135517 type:complete len:112 (-) Transcript_48346:310-645(-)